MTADTALSLDGTGRLDYSLKQGPKRDVLLKQLLQGVTSDPARPSRLEVKFRTRSKSGTLLHVQESSNYTTVKVRRDRHDLNTHDTLMMYILMCAALQQLLTAATVNNETQHLGLWFHNKSAVSVHGRKSGVCISTQQQQQINS